MFVYRVGTYLYGQARGFVDFRNLVCSFLNSVKTCVQLHMKCSVPQAEKEKLILVCIRC